MMKDSLGEINQVNTFVVLWFLLPGNSSLYVKPVPFTERLRFRAFNGLDMGRNVIDNERFKNEFN